jgi:hypothetical protein
MRFAFLSTLLALALALPAQAADNVVREADKTVFKKKTVIDFSDVTLEGDLAKPEGQFGIGKLQTRFKSLIKYRLHFNTELQKSQDQL